MDQIADHRRRLAALTVESVERIAAPAEALAAGRATRDRLRDLKRDVLAELSDLRAEVSRLGKKSRQGRPTLREAWKRRDEGARKLLKDVQERVTGLLDGDEGKALESWSRINQEIDSRLARLAELEPRLARAVVGDRPLTLPGQHRPRADLEERDENLYAAAGAAAAKPERAKPEQVMSDDTYAAAGATAAKPEPAEPEPVMSDKAYAAVGAATRRGERHDAYCPHCGQGVESGDRFCRKCGHRLG